MAVTIAKEQLHKIPTAGGSGLILGVFLVTFDASYPTGGEEVDLSGYMKQVLDIKVQATEDSAGYDFDVDDSNFATAKPKIEANWSATHAHDLKFAAAGGANAVKWAAANELTDGVGGTLAGGGAASGIQKQAAVKFAEVDNGTDLSAVKVRCVVWGIG